ncbi:MAG: hypothetical protein PUB26_03575 [Mycoplasmataceae bacterium]|nr:hypothetical protein [Mycoplasmataceae bacterium]
MKTNKMTKFILGSIFLSTSIACLSCFASNMHTTSLNYKITASTSNALTDNGAKFDEGFSPANILGNKDKAISATNDITSKVKPTDTSKTIVNLRFALVDEDDKSISLSDIGLTLEDTKGIIKGTPTKTTELKNIHFKATGEVDTPVWAYSKAFNIEITEKKEEKSLIWLWGLLGGIGGLAITSTMFGIMYSKFRSKDIKSENKQEPAEGKSEKTPTKPVSTSTKSVSKTKSVK